MKRIRRGLLLWKTATLALSATAQPLLIPDLPVMKLDEVGVYAVGYAYRGQAEQQFSTGWSGFFEARTGVACGPFGLQNGKDVFFLHCPWRNGTGITFQQFAFSLPSQATRILLRGATAMRTENVTNSDGVTFRLFANGTKVFDYHQTNDVWRPFEYDLTALRGSNVTIRFEVDPGPRNDASFDYSFWGDRELVLEGYSPPAIAQAAPQPLALSNLWSGQTIEVAPQSAFLGKTTTSLSNGVARLRYAGPDGVLEYQWSAPRSATDGLWGSLMLTGHMTGEGPISVPLANSAGLSWTEPATPIESGWWQTNSVCILWRSFRVGAVTATVRITGEMIGKSLVLTVTCDSPKVTAFDAGVWGPALRRKPVTTPYYTGNVWFLPREGLFVNEILDWTVSAAASQDGNTAHYEPLADGTRILLRERAIFTAAWHLAEVLPNPPNPPSPWRDFLANRIVLDIWGGKFDHIAANLTTLADYGITNCVAIIHDWQRSGYDNALPMHFPANAAYGGDAGMSHLIATGARLGIRCAPHENYVDYYPNYDSFNTNDIALDSAGKLQKAWYNPGTRIQSFAVKPNAILRLATEQSPEIHRRYATQADYLDVHSSVPPWFHVEQRAGETGAGQFGRVWDIHRQLWAYERTTHSGPVLGEGNHHWYWSGCLDGVEAQFGSGWPDNGGFTAPLAVEFDLLKIHPLQFNHGMGYHSRWWPTDAYQTNWAGGTTPMIVLDRYRAQEVAYGHAGFLDGSLYANLPLAWLEHHLLSPVMARYATARPVDIRYERSGNWLDATALARLAEGGAKDRVRIRYENGLTLTVNGSSNLLEVGSWRLPDWGWIAEGPGLTAGTLLRGARLTAGGRLRGGFVTDFADTGDTLFVNARAAIDWNLSAHWRICPSVESFQQTGTRAFTVSYRWLAEDGLPQDYQCLVHFCQGEAIRAQQDHTLATPTSQWRTGQSIHDGTWNVSLPANLPDGDYDWVIGLFDAAGDGSRVHLEGVDDGTTRFRLGKLHLAKGGALVAFHAETGPPTPAPTAWYTPHLNNANEVIDFDDLRTDGSVRLRREGNIWRLQTWPRKRHFTLELNAKRFGAPERVQSAGGTSPEVTPMPAGGRWRLPLNGASEYRWTNALPRLSIKAASRSRAGAEGIRLLASGATNNSPPL